MLNLNSITVDILEPGKSMETASNQELKTDSMVFSERVVKEKPNLIMSIKDVPHSGWYSIYLACSQGPNPFIFLFSSRIFESPQNILYIFFVDLAE